MPGRLSIRTAALAADAKLRVALAAKLLAAHGTNATVADWDGTRCDVVVAAGADAYGRKVAAAAQQRGFHVLLLGAPPEIGGAGPTLSEDSSPAAILRALQGLALAPATPARTTVERTSNGEGRPAVDGTPGIVAFAERHATATDDVMAVQGSLRIVLRPGAGRVLAAEYSTILRARERLAAPGWQFNATSARDKVEIAGWISRSLDGFMLLGALHRAADLPLLPARRFRLDDWPDLAEAGDQAAALRMASRLIDQPQTCAELAASCHVDPGAANAFLWACKASGLLRASTVDSLPPSVQAAAPRHGIMLRLARRLGLAR